jgi:lipopolysaccharide assembly outer membrane protein LptD (OstA)
MRFIKISLFALFIFISLAGLYPDAEHIYDISAPAESLVDTLDVDTLVIIDDFDFEEFFYEIVTAVFDSLSYTADSLYYFVDIEKIILTGNATIVYGRSKITADTISVNFENNQAQAKGHIVMEDDVQLILGEHAYYDIDTETGIIFTGASRFDLGYYYGQEIRKVAQEVFDIDSGEFTTCDAYHPHFDIRATYMRVYRDHMVVGKPVVFYVNDFPVMALPFAAFSIKRGRKSGVLVPEPGFNPNDGKYLRNIAFYYVISDYSDFTVSANVMEKTGYSYNFDLYYMDRYRYNGRFVGNYHYRLLSPDTHRDDWYLNYRHFQQLPERATFDVNLDFASSRQVWETEVDVNRRLTERITSTVSYRKPFTTSSFFVGATYTDDFVNKDKRLVLPSFSYNMPSRPIHEYISAIPDSVRKQDHWWKSFSLNWSLMGTHTGHITDPSPSFAQVLYKSVKDEDGRYISEHHAGVRQNIGLSWNTTMFTWLKVGSTLSYHDAIMDRDRHGRQMVHGYAYHTNHTASFSLYGIRRFQNFPVMAVRHIVTPSASFRYSPDFVEQNSRFYSFGGVGVSSTRKQRFVGLNLDQRWQFRLTPDKQGQNRYLNELISHRVSTSYDLEKDEQKWGDIHHSVNLNPGGYDIQNVRFSINQSYSTTQKPYENFNLTSYRVSSGLTLSGDALYTDYFPLPKNNFITGNYFLPDTLSITDQQIRTIQDIERLEQPGSWSLNTTHDYSYERRRRYETQNLRNSANVRITQNWSLSYHNYYDIKNSTLISQSLNVSRDVHCWKIVFTYTKSANFWDYRIVFFNIKLPDSLRLQTRGSS